MSRRAAALALVLLAIGFAATFAPGPWSDERVNDLFVYRQAAAPMLDGRLPYRDVFLEYPPLAAPVIALPGLAGTGEHAYRLAFAALALLLATAQASTTAPALIAVWSQSRPGCWPQMLNGDGRPAW